LPEPIWTLLQAISFWQSISWSSTWQSQKQCKNEQSFSLNIFFNRYPEIVGVSNSSFRKAMKHLGDTHRELGVPTDAYPMVGMSVIATLKPFSEQFAENSKDTATPVTQKELDQAFVGAYGPTTSFTFYPMLQEEHTFEGS
jgi:hemoglobin-like flavoprotein